MSSDTGSQGVTRPWSRRVGRLPFEPNSDRALQQAADAWVPALTWGLVRGPLPVRGLSGRLTRRAGRRREAGGRAAG